MRHLPDSLPGRTRRVACSFVGPSLFEKSQPVGVPQLQNVWLEASWLIVTSSKEVSQPAAHTVAHGSYVVMNKKR